MGKEPGRAALIAAFAAVYVIWGSTYLGIRYAIESIPPLLMAGSRFAVAGAVLFAIGRLRGGGWPSPREWFGAGVTGALLLTVGNGGVTWAEQTVPSGIAALVVSVVPLWMTVLDWVRPKGVRPSRTTLGGLALGTVGLLVLVGPSPGTGGAQVGGVGVAVLLGATLAWAGGSVLARHVPLPRSPVTATSAQMVTGGGFLLVAGLLSGEGADLDPALVTPLSLAAWGYLVVFGSLIGFSAYVWLLRTTSPAKVSTYAFVNPVVAVLLGAGLASEPVDGRTLLAMAVIVSGVALIVVSRVAAPGGATSAARRAGSGRLGAAWRPWTGSRRRGRWSAGSRVPEAVTPCTARDLP